MYRDSWSTLDIIILVESCHESVNPQVYFYISNSTTQITVLDSKNK